MDGRNGGQNIRAQSVINWACSSSSRSGIPGQFARLVLARGFLIYLKTSYPAIEIPDTNLIARCHRSNPYVFSMEKLLKVLMVTGEIEADAQWSIHPRTAKTLFALMACTGLRPGEAIKLTIADLLLDEKPSRLLIRDTKFHKTRWVPLHSTAANRLGEYLKWRRRFKPATLSDALFPSKKGKHLHYLALRRLFLHVINSAGISSQAGQLSPSLHSLRHTFAVERVRRWYQDGSDARLLMPNLSVYLGHVHIEGTYWYLSSTPELMAAAAHLFENYSDRGGSA